MSHPNKKRLRRSMMFLNCQKPGLIKDPYIYRPDSIMLDLEDAVAENQKDAARYSLYHALQEIDYRGVERVVRINGLDTPHWKEDIRVCVAGGADTIRIAKTETAQDVHTVEEHVLAQGWQWILNYLQTGDYEDFGVFPSKLPKLYSEFQEDVVKGLIEQKYNIARIPFLRETEAYIKLRGLFRFGKLFFSIRRSDEFIDYLNSKGL